MTARDELLAAVAERAQGTPYVVVPTPEGFDLRVDLADARWYGPLGAAGRRAVVQHRVVLDEAARRYTLTDDHLDLRWDAGVVPGSGPVPRLVASAQATRFRGRVHQVASEKTLGVDARTGEPGTVVDILFRSADGQRMVREPAQALGWSPRMSPEQRAGVIAAVAGGGVAAAVGVTIAVLAAVRAF